MIYAIDLNPSLDRTLRYERLTLGEVNRAASVRTDLSGKGVNVATALRALGVAAPVVGLAGGVTGRVLEQGLAAAGYSYALVPVAGETRCNITVIDDASGVTTKLNERGPQVSSDDLAALETLLLGHVRQGDWCVLSGSLPPGAPADTYARLIRQLHELGVRVALDSSGSALTLGCAAQPDLLKPNEAEARQLLGAKAPADWATQAACLLALGPKQVLLTLGADGALWLSAEGLWRATAPTMAEVNAVVAGDAALAGALYGLQAGWSASACLRWAVAAGSAKAGCEGTAMPTPDQIAALAPQVIVQPLEAKQ